MNQQLQTQRPLNRLVIRITSWIGSPSSMVVHTLVFLGVMILPLLGVDEQKVLLILTTVVSLEAIYLSIFIQYSVNQHSEALTEVATDIDEVTEDVKEISTDVEELSADVEDISENLEEHLGDPESELGQPNYEALEQQVHLLLDEVQRLKQNQPTPPPTH